MDHHHTDPASTTPGHGSSASEFASTHPSEPPSAPQQSQPPNAKFRRRSSMNANDAAAFHINETDGESGTAAMHESSVDNDSIYPPVPGSSSPIAVKSVARLCGTSRSKCGYCAGKRLNVLAEHDDYNIALHVKSSEENVVDSGNQQSNLGRNKEDEVSGSGFDEDDDDEEEEEIDENTTSKSYGLLFDSLPYDTYLEFINRGWRRSGKHLYRPHNFESCCPAISIRLDVSKFSPNTSQQAKKSEAAAKSNLAKAVLVGGSKSQRKVGKKIMQALENYNSRVTVGNNDPSNAPNHQQSRHPGRSSVLSSCSLSSVNASKIEKMQLDDIDLDLACEKDVCLNEGAGSESLRRSKKSRRFSPHPTAILENALTPSEMSKIQHSSESVSLNLDINRQKLQLVEKHEQIVLAKLARVGYETITRKAIYSVSQSSLEQATKPHWVWWKDGDDEGKQSELPKWCLFKIVPNSIKSVPKYGDSCNKMTDISLMVSTTACAAASGRSRGMLNKVELARSVVDAIKSVISNDSFKREMQTTESIFREPHVSLHEKSGHVQITFRVSRTKLASIVEMNAAPLTPPLPSNHAKMNLPDPISEFLSRHQANIAMSSVPTAPSSNLISGKRFLTVRSIPVHESSLQPEVHELFCRYQAAVHGDSNPFEEIKRSSGLEDSDGDSNNSSGDEYAFYQRMKHRGFLNVDDAYNQLSDSQRAKIKKSYVSFYRFLCETPLGQDAIRKMQHANECDGYEINIPYGTYHQQYRLSTSPDASDGPLIAVGVVDLLPSCLSSVYAFYDPELSNHLELGKYTALREIEWVSRAMQTRRDLRYYYLGYYIHSCQKMVYKAEYKPSELLCPVNLKWVDFETAKKRLEERSPVRHCAVLSDEMSSDKTESKEQKTGFTIDDIDLDIGAGTPVNVGHLNEQGRELIDPIIDEFVGEVGIGLCEKLVVKLA